MKKVSRVFLMVGLMVGLSACGGANNNGAGAASGEGQSVATFSEQDIAGDLVHLDSKEKGLESVGMRFRTSVDSASSITYCSWDPEAFTTAYKSNPTLTQADMVKALQDYLDAANAFLKKYEGSFTFKKSGLSIITRGMSGSARI